MPFRMPELISVQDFISQTLEDLSSPTTSSFTSHMGKCRGTVCSLEEALDSDRAVLQKMRKATKAEHASGQDLASHIEAHIAAQEKFSANYQSDGDEQLAGAFLTFAEFSRELLAPVKGLLQSLSHNINFSLDSLVKRDLKELKGDFKKPFDKAWKDYENKLTKIEKEKRELAKQHGLVRSEVVGGEIAEEMEKERRMFQLNMCEYLIKVNEIQTKKGVDLLQNHIKHCNAQFNFFQECLRATETLKQFIEKLTPELQSMKVRQDEEKQQLFSLRDHLKTALQLEQKEDSANKQLRYNMHQLQGNKQYGTEKSGNLFKKSDGLRKVWQKRKCTIQNGYLTIFHSTLNRPPAKLNLLTCQVKPNPDDRKCFDLISHNRTYHFLAEDEQECSAWISVLSNSKEEALNVAFSRVHGSQESSMEGLTRAIIEEIKCMPGNSVCCDCSAPDPAWLSINLGILICIECSGIHREMGVHHSRIQSLSLDKLATSELLLAKNIGNSGFNDILEANLPSPLLKPTAGSDMALRKDFIISKYVERKYAKRSSRSPAAQRQELQEAIRWKDLFALLQAYAEKVDLSELVLEPVQEPGETVLHLAVLLADRTSLHIVDFLVQNSGSLVKQTVKGNTPLHYCCLHNKPECLKLFVRAKASIAITNEAEETALDVARRMRHSLCEELLLQAQNNQFNMRVHVEYEWRLGQDDMYESDDDLDEKLGSPKERILRPQSCYHSPATASQPWGNAAGLSKGAIPAPQGKLHDIYAHPHSHIPAAPASAPCVPPLPPRSVIRAPNLPPPAPPASQLASAVDPGVRRILSLPLSIKHKRTSSEPVPWVPLSPTQPSHSSLAPDSGSSSPPKGHSAAGAPPRRLSTGSRQGTSHSATKDTTQPAALGTVETLCEAGPSKGRSRGLPWPSQDPGGGPGPAQDVPPPIPRRDVLSKTRLFRVRALYDCQADREDELTFRVGEIIIVAEEEDSNWWSGWIEGQPHRKGVFPASFVHVLSE
ncbi:arf-GAP with SH3 domain, ANK repeat and PH domain-containing protein 2-like isoform X1 [Mauremys reevesii]|uniref:arf-GAP with SH3 domain, ANK repeat and PH domain-containing protein 2-like isoform X1 n=2 Tax=Mauremys reevesii TaxID=260615 RepID=UPI00193EFEA4|nr:arf-GAP with SH3 domain, ANK repeat and PH domain-containing protein 2-like isoform X1 [Mauremys reevesii]